jgi:hypothetical protein
VKNGRLILALKNGTAIFLLCRRKSLLISFGI